MIEPKGDETVKDGGPALDHLGKVLLWLEGLSSDYHCPTITNAVAFYNEARPDKKVDLDSGPFWEPIGIYRLAILKARGEGQ